jgi:iron(III) transport system substrate-binding protein
MRPALYLLLLFALTGVARADAELIVYSERQEPLIKPIFDTYTQETGVKIRYLTDSAPVLIERLAAEGDATRADLFMSVDAGNLWQAAERGLLAKTQSDVLDAQIPANLRDPDGQWVSLSLRARTIVYGTERVKPSELSTYEALAEPQWKGRLCLRSSKKVYNQSLTATMIARLGAEKTEDVLRGWVANLAAPPFADDTQLINAIAAGQCDAGLVNTYYLGRLLKADPALPVTVFWPNQQDAGVHVNVSGAGITKHSKHKAEAQKLLEWLASDTAQDEFARLNFEFPAKAGIAVDPIVAAWGTFKADPVNVVEAGRRQAEAVRLMDRAGWK